MYITEVLLRKSIRLPWSPKQIEGIKFVELVQLRLQNKIDPKSEKGADVTCLQEMAVMFACMKKNDFREAKCSEEIDVFNKCYAGYVQEKKVKKEREISGEMVTGRSVKKVTTRQLNWLLKKYPQVNEKL